MCIFALDHGLLEMQENSESGIFGLGVCCFVLLNRYWEIVTVAGSFLKAEGDSQICEGLRYFAFWRHEFKPGSVHKKLHFLRRIF